MSDLIKKWEMTGLLDKRTTPYPTSEELRKKRLDTDWKQKVAEYLEEAALAVIGDENSDEYFNGMVMPLVRRIYDEGKELKADYEKMKEIYFEVIEKHGDTFKAFKEMGMLDAEFELCALIGEYYIERYGENETK